MKDRRKIYKNIIVILTIMISIILLVTIYFLSETVRTITNVLVISFVVAYSIKPIRNSISERFKITKRLSSIIIILTVLVVLVLCLYIMIPTLIKELSNFSELTDGISKTIQDVSDKFKLRESKIYQDIYIIVMNKLNELSANISNTLINKSMESFDDILAFAVIPVISYYFLVDGEGIYNKLLLVLPTEKRVIIRTVLKDIDKVLERYIISQFMLSLIIGGLTCILLIVFRVKFAPWLAILNGILNIIPYFGPIIGGVPAIIIALLDSPVKALWIAIGVVVIQQVEGDILAPKITGDSTNLHPIVIIIILLIGERLGGGLGMIIAVPIVVIIKVIYDDINYYLF